MADFIIQELNSRNKELHHNIPDLIEFIRELAAVYDAVKVLSLEFVQACIKRVYYEAKIGLHEGSVGEAADLYKHAKVFEYVRSIKARFKLDLPSYQIPSSTLPLHQDEEHRIKRAL